MKVSKWHYTQFKTSLSFKSKATQKTYLSIIKSFLVFSNFEVNTQTILEFLKEQKPNSILTAYYAIKFFCKTANIPFDISHDDIAPSGHINVARPHLSREEVKALIQTTKKHAGILENGYVALFTVYGCRRSEAFEMKAGDIYTKDGNLFLKIYAKKKGRIREHLVPEEIKDIMIEFKKLLKPLEKKKNREFYVEKLNEMFDNLCYLAGITFRKWLGIHSIRRALVSELSLTDLPPLVIKDFLRWRLPGEILQLYAMPDPLTVDKMVFEKHPFLEFWKEGG